MDAGVASLLVLTKALAWCDAQGLASIADLESEPSLQAFIGSMHLKPLEAERVAIYVREDKERHELRRQMTAAREKAEAVLFAAAG